MREGSKVSAGTNRALLWDVGEAGGWGGSGHQLLQEPFVQAVPTSPVRLPSPAGPGVTLGHRYLGKDPHTEASVTWLRAIERDEEEEGREKGGREGRRTLPDTEPSLVSL